MANANPTKRHSRFVDLTGRRFGMLVVLRLIGTRPKTMWECRCDCGTAKPIWSSTLQSGRAASCGCANRFNSARSKAMAEAIKSTLILHRLNAAAGTVLLPDGRIAHFDPADAEVIAGYVWHSKKSNQTFYAQTGLGGRSKKIEMHVLLMGKRDGHEIDHIDGNGLNNRRSNLRWATSAQNQFNRRKISRPCKSRFKGVRLSGTNWIALVHKGGVRFNLGTYPTEEEAARAYDRKAAELFGEFAKLNYPEFADES